MSANATLPIDNQYSIEAKIAQDHTHIRCRHYPVSKTNVWHPSARLYLQAQLSEA